MIVHSTPNRHTLAVPLVLAGNAGVGITFGCHTLTYPSPWTRHNLDSSVKQFCSQLLSVTQWGLVARRCLSRMGPRHGRRACSVNHPRWLRMLCLDIRALWRPGVSATVLVDGLHLSHRCFMRISRSCAGVVPGRHPLRGWLQVIPISCRRCLNHKIVVCGILKRLAQPAAFKLVCSIVYILSFLCRRW